MEYMFRWMNLQNLDGYMDLCMDGWMGKYLFGQYEWMNEQTDAQTDVWADVWTDAWMDGLMDRCIDFHTSCIE